MNTAAQHTGVETILPEDTESAQILEDGTVPFEMRGSHRRIRLQSILDYQESLKATRAEALDRMQLQSVEDGVYDVLNDVMDED
ncbi:hypothetical protein [Corynebacterium sp.]|uniref:hypothetical protein n=1 Tax=Corynebacterium sp. TaxID=1720 RepID=UPI0028AFAE73|nr:hypothetical protein [Corynebacterium sp.]